MKYKVYELVKPEMLKRIEHEGYDKVTKELITLEEVTYSSGLDYSYNSELEAMTDIRDNKDRLKHKDLVIMPIVSVNWNGEIS